MVRNGAVSSPFSVRLRWLSVVLTLLVPYAHVPYFGPFTFTYPALSYAFTFWRRGVVAMAVESFLVISGYLFFVTYEPSWKTYLGKIRRRVWTVLVPYLIWVGLGVLYEAYRIGGLPKLSVGLAQLGLTAQYPSVVSLWYLRDLFVLCLLAPVLYILIHHRWSGAALLAGLGALQWVPMPWALEIFKYAFWFAIGGYVAIHVSPSRLLIGYRPIPVLVVWLGAVLISTSLLVKHGAVLQILEPAYVVMGFLAVWNLVARLDDAPLSRWLSRHTFFVFCSHGLFNTWLSRMWLALVPVTGISLVMGFFTVPIVSILCGLSIGHALRAYLPDLYSLVTGGRGLRY